MAAPHCGTSLGARAGYRRGQPWGQENGKKCAVHHQGWVHSAFFKIFLILGWFLLGGHMFKFHCSGVATAALDPRLSAQRIWGLKVHLPLLSGSIPAPRMLGVNFASLLPPHTGPRSPQVPGREVPACFNLHHAC